jgi:hypothetical protein
MDLPLFARVAGRHKIVTTVGLMAAFALAFLAYVHVDPRGDPVFRYRSQAIWASQIRLQIEEPGFVEGKTTGPTRQGDLASLAPLYAQLANSDPVKRIMKADGPVPGGATASAIVDSSRASLPVIEIVAYTKVKNRAVERASRQARAFTAYISRQQTASKIPAKRRISLKVIKGPIAPHVVAPRKKTLPIVVFLSLLVMVAALVFALDNIGTSKRRRAPSLDEEAEETDEDLSVPIRVTEPRAPKPWAVRQPPAPPETTQSGRKSGAPVEASPSSETGESGLRQRSAGQERWNG